MAHNYTYRRDPKNWLIGGAVAAFVLIIFIFLVSPVKRVTTPIGMETVVTDVPLTGGGGVRPKTLKPGTAWIWRFTRTDLVDPKPTVFTEVIDDFVSTDNILLDFESTVTAQVTDWPKMLSKFGTDWWKNNLQRPYIESVRREVKKRTMKQMMSDTETSSVVDSNLTSDIEKAVKELGLPVRIVGINLGRAKPNETILEQMNQTATEQQRLLTLEQSRLAEIKRRDEQAAKAEADNAYRNKIGLNAAEFVQLQLADKQIEACKAAKECVILPPGTPTVIGR